MTSLPAPSWPDPPHEILVRNPGLRLHLLRPPFTVAIVFLSMHPLLLPAEHGHALLQILINAAADSNR